jgi:uncharacterized protein YukE
MAQIRIDTERARDVGRRLMAESDRVSEMRHDLQRAIGNLDTWAWDGRNRRRAEPLLSRVRPAGEAITQEMQALGRMLIHVANTFEKEDNTAAQNLGGMPWVDWETGGQPASGDGTNGAFSDYMKQFAIRQKGLTCYLTAQLMILHALGHTDVTLDDLTREWWKYSYLPGIGSLSLSAVLHQFGVKTEDLPWSPFRSEKKAVDWLSDRLDNHQGVLISVEADILWESAFPGSGYRDNGWPSEGHGIVVTGMVRDENGNIDHYTILDPASGTSYEVDPQALHRAWDARGHYGTATKDPIPMQ